MQLDLGQKIRELRRRDGRTQEALAEAIGVTSQAVSRWEANGGYPDMEMIPSIANYFGVSIDELFGYNNERSKKIDELANKIDRMNAQNSGEDINIDECISLARNALIEFPGNEKIMLCLASVLYNAGYVRYGEYHLSDDEGYDILDTEKHRTYAEWKEAISLYEKLLKTMGNGEPRHRVIRELTQLYLNTGEHTRALEVIETAPDIYGTKEFLKANAVDGKERTEAYGEALLKIVRACSELMVSAVIVNEKIYLRQKKSKACVGLSTYLIRFVPTAITDRIMPMLRASILCFPCICGQTTVKMMHLWPWTLRCYTSGYLTKVELRKRATIPRH